MPEFPLCRVMAKFPIELNDAFKQTKQQQHFSMKKTLMLGVIVLLAGSLGAADSSPKDDVLAAAKKLGEQANYTWKQTVVVPESSPFKPGPLIGQMETGGYTHLSWSFNDNTSQSFMKGDNGVATDMDGNWQTFSELEKAEGFGVFIVRWLKNLKVPAAQASELAGLTKELKKDGDEIKGDLTEEGAKAQVQFGPESTASGAKASVKFWLKNGELVKYEIKATGKVEFNGNEQDVDRTTTIEIKDVGTTKVELPAEVKKKLEPAPAAPPAAPPAGK